MHPFARSFFALVLCMTVTPSHANFRGASVLALLDVQQLSYGVRYRINETCGQAHAKRMVAEGFNAVRLVIAPVPLLQPSRSGRAISIEQIVHCGEIYKSLGMVVVYDITQDPRGWSAISTSPVFKTLLTENVYPLYKTGLLELVRSIQKLDDRRDIVELLNEPPLCNGGPADWEHAQLELYRSIRSESSSVGLLLTACGGQLDQLLRFDPSNFSEDKRSFFSFHFYEPYTFTHQLGNQGIKFTRIPYPPKLADFMTVMSESTDAIERDSAHKSVDFRLRVAGYVASYMKSGVSRTTLKSRLELARLWGRKHKIGPDRLIMGEFGAGIHFRKEDLTPEAIQSQLAWASDVSTSANEIGINWFFWFYPQRVRYWWDQRHGGMKAEWRQALIE